MPSPVSAAIRPARVVLWGGPRIFAAGADVSEFSEPGAAQRVSDAFLAATGELASFPAVTVAAVSGTPLGGGLELALACDLRVVSEDAKLGQPEVLLGIIPGGGATQRLPRLVGTSRAKDMILHGQAGRGGRGGAHGPRRPRRPPPRCARRGAGPGGEPGFGSAGGPGGGQARHRRGGRARPWPTPCRWRPTPSWTWPGPTTPASASPRSWRTDRDGPGSWGAETAVGAPPVATGSLRTDAPVRAASGAARR